MTDKDLIKYYNKQFIFNFNSSKAYEENKMNDVTSNFFKDKSTFNTMFERFSPPKLPTNIYKAEMSSNNQLGIVDNNIMLTIKKSFPINSTIKLNNGKVYTIIDFEWEPGKWIKKIPNELDDIKKIKKSFMKNIKSYDIPTKIVNDTTLYNIDLSDKKDYFPIEKQYDK